jgi:DNA-binding transcriptional LysR family regulator
VELRHLRYFEALADELHFGRAAERVHVVQSALSKQIAALEQELGVTLFDRTTRGVELTPAGNVLRERVAKILPDIDDALDVVRMTGSGETGRLEVGYIAAAMWSVLPRILSEHRRRHPKVLFRLRELPMAGEHLELLLDGSLDAAFIRPIARFRALTFQILLQEQFVAALPEGHPQAANERIDLADLADERFILMSKTRYPQAYDMFHQACRESGFTPTILDEGDSPNALYMVAAGFGVAVAPASAGRSGLPGVVFREFSHPTPQFELAIAYIARTSGPRASPLSWKRSARSVCRAASHGGTYRTASRALAAPQWRRARRPRTVADACGSSTANCMSPRCGATGRGRRSACAGSSCSSFSSP